MQDEQDQAAMDRMSTEGPVSEATAEGSVEIDSIKVTKRVTPSITEADYRSIGAVIEGDLRQTLKTAWDRLKPKDRQLIQRVAIRAAKVEVMSRRTGNPTDAEQRKVIRGTKQVEAQLAAIKAITAKVGTDAFWVLVERVVDRLIRFAI